MIFIPVDDLEVGSVLKEDVYYFHVARLALLKRGQKITTQIIDRLRQHEAPGVYMKDILPEGVKIPKPLISDKLKKEALVALQNMFEANDAPPINELSSVAFELVDTITNHKNVLVNISDLKSYDDYTYHHSVSVAVISIAIGTEMELPKQKLHQLALCALLHDIGKIEIPKELINKPGKLTSDEFTVVKQHAEFGIEYLQQHNFDGEEIYSGVVSHHEKYNGEGYPKQLAGEDIPLFGRIISVADVFDALTSKRPYRDPMSPADAAEYIMGNSNIAFDYEIVKAFMNKMEFYPIGTLVKLSTGKLAVVVQSQNSLRPVVRLLEKPFSTLDLYNDNQNLNITIIKTYQKVSEEDAIRSAQAG